MPIRITIAGFLFGMLPFVALGEEIDFARYDRNADNMLDLQEWRNINELEIEFERADRDNDRQVNRDEIHALLIEMQENPEAFVPATGQQAQTGLGRMSLRDYDLDNDGVLSHREANLQDVPGVTERFEIWDVDNDGALDQAEYDQALADFDTYQVNEDGRLAEAEIADTQFTLSEVEIWDSDGDGLLDRVAFERDIASDVAGDVSSGVKDDRDAEQRAQDERENRRRNR